ncbi:MAG: preprotein translocase subunit SecE, partial [Enterobacteriaceae bacterium]|nr:preprotein translocase subunit SecE [Enterobacteriaceae bacterium]
IIILILLITTKYNEKLVNTLHEAKNELKIITWPNRKEITQSTLSVIAIISCTSLILWILDSILTYIISKIT